MRLIPERLRWRIADLVNVRTQCWSDLVSWVLNDEPVRDTGVAAALPVRPITETCRKDAAQNGRCYCGKVAADGTVLRRGETVTADGGTGVVTARPVLRRWQVVQQQSWTDDVETCSHRFELAADLCAARLQWRASRELPIRYTVRRRQES